MKWVFGVIIFTKHTKVTRAKIPDTIIKIGFSILGYGARSHNFVDKNVTIPNNINSKMYFKRLLIKAIISHYTVLVNGLCLAEARGISRYIRVAFGKTKR